MSTVSVYCVALALLASRAFAAPLPLPLELGSSSPFPSATPLPSPPSSFSMATMLNLPDVPSSPLPTSPPPSPLRPTPSTETEFVTVTQPGPIDIVFNTVYITETSTITAAPTATIAASPSSVSGWTLASSFGSDLPSQLAVKSWAWGETNVAVLPGVPATAWAPAATATSVPANENVVTPNPKIDLYNGTVMQVLYPNGSINPGSKVTPIGGTGMYMTPLDLANATNVTLEYSVFFPVGFDFVKGGKLPGLYGGHKGCSGGKESEDCFSTRLMFRSKGLGELYLYVPKGLQPAELCQTPPLTYCDTQYGLSIGRGAWTFATGAWTNIRQDIVLNTPGIADGAFQIFVNGELRLASTAVMFRRDLTPTPSATTATTPAATSTDSGGGGLLGGLLGEAGDLADGILKKREAVLTSLASPSAASSFDFHTVSTITHLAPQPAVTSVVTSTSTSTVLAPAPLVQPPPPPSPNSLLSKKRVQFMGIMYDTFFGGSQPDYASPMDQYSYFNRVALRVNS